MSNDIIKQAMKKADQKAKISIIVEKGRDQAVSRFERMAIESKTSEELLNNIGILHVEAAHTLATIIINEMKWNKMSEQAATLKVLTGVAQELKFIKQEFDNDRGTITGPNGKADLDDDKPQERGTGDVSDNP